MAGCVPYTQDHLRMLLEHGLETRREMLSCMLAIGAGTGGRISEFVGIRRSTVIVQGRIPDVLKLICLKKRGVRKEYFREIPWNHSLDRFVLPWLRKQENRYGLEFPDDYVFSTSPGRHISRQQAWSILHEAYLRLHIQAKHGTHGMRKFFGRSVFDYYCKKYSDQIKALEMTRRALGHQSIDTTIKYLNLELDGLKEATDKIFEFLL